MCTAHSVNVNNIHSVLQLTSMKSLLEDTVGHQMQTVPTEGSLGKNQI